MTAEGKPSISDVYIALGGRSLVGFRKSGWHKVLCVLHEEREPSATLNESVGRYNCFAGCTDGRAVDSIDLVMRKEGIEDFGEAQRRANELAPSSGEVRGEPDQGSRRMAPRKRDRRGDRAWSPSWRRNLP